MRSATLEAKDVNEYLRDEYPLRYEETTDETELADMAFSLRHSDVGLVPDEIVNLIPYDENILIILCKSSVWELNGGSDLSNARLRPVTDQVGGTAGNSWVVDPARNIYFVGADKGIYQMVLQQPVRRIDLPIEHLTNKFNKFDGRWSLIWDEQEGGIYFHGWDSQNYINLFYSLRTQGWFVDEFGGSTLASQVMVGASLHAKQANEKDTVRLAVWGSKDGELYYVDNEYSGDYRDETTYKALPNTAAIDSFVLFGPMNVKEGDGVGPMDDLRLTKLCFEMVDDSSAIIWGLQAADTASQAREIPARVMGRITHQRLRTSRQRCTGKNIYLHVQSDPSFEEPWSIDNVVMHGEIRSGLKRRT